jgi:hypothetical protein
VQLLGLLLLATAAGPTRGMHDPPPRPERVRVTLYADDPMTLHTIDDVRLSEQADTCAQMHYDPVTGQTLESMGPCTRRDVEVSFSKLCSTPCRLSLASGSWSFGVAKGERDPIVTDPMLLESDVEIEAEYQDRRAARIMGYTIAGVSAAVGAGLLLSTTFEPDDAEFESYEGRVVAGAISLVAALPIALLTSQWKDSVSLRAIRSAE